MLVRNICSICFLYLLAPSHLLYASDKAIFANTEFLRQGQASPQASIQDVAWIAGNWTGEIWGGRFEENWSAPSAGSMMASFKFIKDNQVSFYELITIQEQGQSLVIKLKHFSHDLKGWEAKEQSVDFPLVKIESNAVYFNGYTFKKVSDDQIHVFVVVDSDGQQQEVKFIFERSTARSD